MSPHSLLLSPQAANKPTPTSSDAIVLGLATNTPIFADESVIQQACVMTPPDDEDGGFTESKRH